MSQDWTYNPQPQRPSWGVHAPTHKAQALRRPIVVAPIPREVIISLGQIAGQNLTPLVRAGDQVLTGQPVGRSDTGAEIHASISGVVETVTERPVPAAEPQTAVCVVIRGDGADRPYPAAPATDPMALSPAEIRRGIARAGIVGLGGALFSTAIKLATDTPIRALLVNGAECEPWISCDEMLLREHASAVIQGAQIMMRALDTSHAVIVVEADMPEARVAVHDAIAASGASNVGFAVVTAKYPAGGERQLIELITGEEVPAGSLPKDIGYICQNVGTAAAVADFFIRGRPLISRIVTVTGEGVQQPGNFEVRIGTPIRDLIAIAGGYQHSPRRLIMGGPMMGFALPDDDLPITKASNCIVAATAAELAPARPEMPCIRCGECVQACPANLLPQELLAASRRNDPDRLDELGVLDCIECGCCDYVCPSYIALTPRFVMAKTTVRERRHVTARAGHARERFDARGARLEREQHEQAQDFDAQIREVSSDTAEHRGDAIRGVLERAGQPPGTKPPNTDPGTKPPD